MALEKGLRSRVLEAAHARGPTHTHVARVALFGTRAPISVNAGTATPQRAAVGVGVHSVWQGPRQIAGGDPVLKRNRSA